MLSQSQRSQPLEVRKHKTARDFALDTLRRAIVEGRLLPGQELRDNELSQQMGISRTPVREAIQVLEVQGFVVHPPFSKPTVSQQSAEQIEEVYMIRKALEGIATYHACLLIDARGLQRLKRLTREEARIIERGESVSWSKCNRRFHTALYAASGKPFLCRQIDWLLDLSTIYMMTSEEFLRQRLEGSNADHIRIVKACEARNPELARRILEDHLEKSAALLMDYASTIKEQRPQQ